MKKAWVVGAVVLGASLVLPVRAQDLNTVLVTFLNDLLRVPRKATGTIYWENPVIANGADTNYVSTTAYALPASSLATNGDQLVFVLDILFSSASSTKTYQCNIGYSAWTAAGGFTGGVSVINNSTTTASASVTTRGVITRTAAAASAYQAINLFEGTSANQSTVYTVNGTTPTWTSANNILCAVKDGSSNAAAATIEEFRILYVPKGP